MRKILAAGLLWAGLSTAVLAEQATLKIEGMSCPSGCVKKVDTALGKLKGVTERKVQKGSATVTYDATKVSKTDLIKAIEKAGYTVASK